jgi:hypothetical protein
MKPYLVFIILITFLSYQATAQTPIKAKEASNHIGKHVLVCDTINSIIHIDGSDSTLLILGGNDSNTQLTITVKGFTLNPEDYFKGQNPCVAGVIIYDRNKPEIRLTDPEMIFVHKASILGKTGSDERRKITHVMLGPPPNAHYFGERYRSIKLTELTKAGEDTIKITEVVTSYKFMKKSTLIYFGGAYPNQKITIVLKGQAKEYLDAMLKIQYKGTDPLQILNSKKFMAIGKVTQLKGKPQIVITSPNLFTIIPD